MEKKDKSEVKVGDRIIFSGIEREVCFKGHNQYIISLKRAKQFPESWEYANQEPEPKETSLNKAFGAFEESQLEPQNSLIESLKAENNHLKDTLIERGKELHQANEKIKVLEVLVEVQGELILHMDLEDDGSGEYFYKEANELREKIQELKSKLEK